MPAHRKTSLSQVIELLVYLEKHKNIQLGTAAPKGNGHLENEHWKKIAKILNNCPGESKDAAKWKCYWNELKCKCRKKLAKGLRLLPYEKRVLTLAGGVRRFTGYVIHDDKLKLEAKDSCDEKHDDESKDMDEVDNSRLSNLDQNCSSPDPMPTVDVIMENYLSDNEEEEREISQEEAEHIPEWLQKIEQSRLSLEERTTRAIEQMSAGVAAIAAAMENVVGSLQALESSIR